VLTLSLAATSRTLSRWSAPPVMLRKFGDKEGTPSKCSKKKTEHWPVDPQARFR
jgi:hypothetical protein